MAKLLFISDLIRPDTGSAISLKPLYAEYERRYLKYIQKNIKIHCVKDKKDYIIHALVPSEKNDQYEIPIYYDVVLQFSPSSKEDELSTNIKDYSVKEYSNIPSWIFDFTYVFYKAGAIPPWIPTKFFNEKAMTIAPKKTNPKLLFGIERVTWSVIRHLELVTGFRKNQLDLITLPSAKASDLLKKIMGQEEKFAEVELEEKRMRIKKEGAKQDKKKPRKNIKSKFDEQGIRKKEKEQQRLVKSLDATNFKTTFESALKQNLKKESELVDIALQKGGSTKNLKKDFRSSLKK
jgi:hypothetical protein